jgi:DNA-binding MarR family transcriptional regulator
METKEKVLKAMKDAAKPLRPGEIADMAGIDKKDAEKAIKHLKDADLIHSPKRCFWEAR